MEDIKYQIVVVDDDENSVEAIKQILISAFPKYEIVDFTSPQVCLDYLINNFLLVICIVSDMNISEMDGLNDVSSTVWG